MLCGGRNVFLILVLLVSAGRRAIGSACFNGTDYMCVDWSLGSERMYLAQYKYMKETGENVLFGVGSYGPQSRQNMGKCFKFYIENQPTPFIAQVTNHGVDINENQFDMQMGGGGFGIFNACVAPTNRVPNGIRNICDTTEFQGLTSAPLFPGSVTQWGARCGGHFTREGCRQLPDYPTQLREVPIPPGSLEQEPSLKELCDRSFELQARQQGNAVILSGWRVACPSLLVDVTGLQRSDEGASQGMPRGVLTSTMDCCAPAGSSVTSFDAPTVPGRERVIPCKSDGYTRATEG